jgi:Calcineurin-like phosphoesterase
MATPQLSEDLKKQALEAVEKYGTVTEAARAMGLSRNTLQSRVLSARSEHRITDWTFPREALTEVEHGSVVVFSDAHYWPGEPSLAHTALLKVIRKIKPRIIVANGDIFDGAGVSRHDPFGWSRKPNAREEIEVCQERLLEVELAAPKGCELVWNVGNHDSRFEKVLCSRVPEFAAMNLMRLADHFPNWDIRFSTWINRESVTPVMVKHRHAGGVHAGYNNAMKGGVTMVTGHTHNLEVKPWGDYTGRRWGVQTGCIADHHSAAFEYTENGPSPACSGFAVLTFRDGVLLPPELCEVIRGKALFRGEVVA